MKALNIEKYNYSLLAKVPISKGSNFHNNAAICKKGKLDKKYVRKIWIKNQESN